MSSAARVRLFYTVDKETFDKYMLKRSELDPNRCINYPKRIAKKIGNILKHLAAAGFKWTVLGSIIEPVTSLPSDFNLLQYCAYLITGEGKEPAHLSTFLGILADLELPLKWFCTKIQTKLRKLQRNRKEQQKHDSKKKTNKEKEANQRNL